MDYIKDFATKEVGLDALSSDVDDIELLSDLVAVLNLDFCDDRKNLYDYYVSVINDENARNDAWQVIVYEPEIRAFNAYRGVTAHNYQISKPVLTAREILGNLYIPVLSLDENDIDDVFMQE